MLGAARRGLATLPGHEASRRLRAIGYHDGLEAREPKQTKQHGEELAAALNTSLEDLERARADVSGAVEKAREQEQLRSASEANADRCVRMPLRPAPRSRMR